MLTLIIGGARGGKSSHALQLARERGGNAVAYIAPAVATDEEMADRIRRHRLDRPAAWTTIEEPLDLLGALRRAAEAGARVAVVDCLTLWLYNATEEGWTEEQVLSAAAEAARAARESSMDAVVVTNELGWGVVPATESGRHFRDTMGRVNQLWAGAADEVLLVIAGLPIRAK
jgi:adenosylcobinamide kinase / adenosylcobinamide-phosphate guanylyltransferase